MCVTRNLKETLYHDTGDMLTSALSAPQNDSGCYDAPQTRGVRDESEGEGVPAIEADE